MGIAKGTREFSAAIERAFSDPIGDQKNFSAYSHRFASEYETALKILTATKTAEALSALMEAYLNLYDKYAANQDNLRFYRSDQVFASLIEQAKRVTSNKRSLLDDWIGELTAAQPTRIKKRYDALNPTDKSTIKKLIEDRKQSKSILSLLRDEYTRQRHTTNPTDAELRGFDPVPDQAFKNEFEQAVAAVKSTWDVAMAGNDDMSRTVLHNALGFYRAYLEILAVTDVLRLFQVIKYFQDRMTTKREAIRGGTKVTSGDRDVLTCELYTMACIELLVHAQGRLRLPANRLRFTPEEQGYLLWAVHNPRYEYASNIEHRLSAQLRSVDAAFGATTNFLDVFLISKNQIQTADLVALGKTLELERDWEQIDIVMGKLKKAGSDAAAARAVVDDPRSRKQLETLQKYLTPQLVIGDHNLGRKTVKVGGTPGSHHLYGQITIVRIDSEDQIYIEFEALKPNVFLVRKGYLDNKAFGAGILAVYNATIGMVYVIEGLFTMLGFLPAFIEGGFVAVIVEVMIYFGSNKLGEWAGEVHPLFGQLVALAAGFVVPRPNMGRGFKGDVEIEAPAAATARDSALIENRGIKERSGAPAIERSAIVEKPAYDSAAKTVPANDNRPINFDDAIARVQELESREGQMLDDVEKLVAANDNVAAAQAADVQAAESVRASGQYEPISMANRRGRQASPAPQKGRVVTAKKAAASGGRGTGNRGTGNKQLSTDPRLTPEVRLKLGNSRFADFVEAAAKSYRDTMKRLKPIFKKNVTGQSTRAHNDTLKEMNQKYPEAVRGKQRTGVMDTNAGGKGTVRESDVAYYDPALGGDANYNGPVVELKAWAYVTEKGVLRAAGGEAGAVVTSPQIQCYEVMVDELGIPVFVINERGHIYARDTATDTWFRADIH